MRSSLTRAYAWVAVLLILLLAATSCVETGGEKADSEIPPRDPSILIGAFNFSESRVLAEVYRQALEANGFDADVLSDVGPREVIEPALEQEQIDIAIEYLGAALAFLDPDAVEDARTPQRAYELLDEAFADKNVELLSPAPGQNRNEYVVTAETAAEHDLATISDLQKVDSEMVFGGPPECPARPLCLQGLRSTYQLEFESFVPLDSGGPRTVAALETGEVDAALLFTTNPVISDERLVVLKDDRGLQPAENIVPVVRRELLEEHGRPLAATLDSVSRLLTDQELRFLNAEIDIEHKPAEAAASDWLQKHGLVHRGSST